MSRSNMLIPPLISIRLPAPLIDRLDALTDKMNADPDRVKRVLRIDVAQITLIRGIKEIKADLGKEQRP